MNENMMWSIPLCCYARLKAIFNAEPLHNYNSIVLFPDI